MLRLTYMRTRLCITLYVNANFYFTLLFNTFLFLSDITVYFLLCKMRYENTVKNSLNLISQSL